MHYSQASRAQEPPRLPPSAGVVAFTGAGDADTILDVPAKQERPYDLARAGELYRVNCSVCHGMDGAGDGKAAAALSSTRSYFATKNGSAYPAPPSLQAAVKRAGFDKDVAYTTLTRGVLVMPRFGALLSEEDMRDIVSYLFDAQDGIASK